MPAAVGSRSNATKSDQTALTSPDAMAGAATQQKEIDPMTDEQPYSPEWLNDHPRRADPRLSDVLDDYQPSAAIRARVADLWCRYAARDPEAVHTLLDLAADAMEDITDDHRAFARVLLALLEQATVTAVGAQGEELTVRRLASQVAAHRADVLDEAGAL